VIPRGASQGTPGDLRLSRVCGDEAGAGPDAVTRAGRAAAAGGAAQTVEGDEGLDA